MPGRDFCQVSFSDIYICVPIFELHIYLALNNRARS